MGVIVDGTYFWASVSSTKGQGKTYKFLMNQNVLNTTSLPSNRHFKICSSDLENTCQ